MNQRHARWCGETKQQHCRGGGGGGVFLNAWRPQPSAVREQGGADSAPAAG